MGLKTLAIFIGDIADDELEEHEFTIERECENTS
jgi:hypothetical protein